MHELGLCEPILDAVERRAAGRRVTGVGLRVGTLQRVVAPALAQAFALVAQGTVADGATVDLTTVPAWLSCAACGHQQETVEPLAACPTCGAPGPELTGGDELILEWIRVASGDEQGGARVPLDSG
jgi:hydrogenase nickel incorporation protein HypA/HybF